MRLFTKSYDKSEYVGDCGKSFTDYREFLDLEQLLKIEKEDDIALHMRHEWTDMGSHYLRSMMEGVLKPPLFKSIYEEDDIKPLDPRSINFSIYLIEPIDDFRFYIEIFWEDLFNDEDLCKYVIQGMKKLREKKEWEGDLRNGLYISIIPTEEMRPVLIVKQDNNGDTFLVSPVRIGQLDQYNLLR